MGRLAGALKVGAADADARVEELVGRGLLQASGAEGDVAVTQAGAQRARPRPRRRQRDHRRLWGDLPAEDLDTTGRTLAAILERANAHYATA